LAKYPTNPLIIDHCRSISTGNFKFSTGIFHKGTFRWEDGSSLGYVVNTMDADASLELDFKVDGHSIHQRIKLTSIPSNLGIGRIWLFICPVTKSRCRKLHLISHFFAHRTAVPGYAYQKQIEPKGFRALRQSWERIFGIQGEWEELNSTGMKTVYRGQPTKWILKLVKKYS